jgi:hypothetical protein
MSARNFPPADFGMGTKKGYVRLSCFTQSVQCVLHVARPFSAQSNHMCFNLQPQRVRCWPRT